MYRTMKGVLATLVMLLGALALTGLLATGLQQKATAGHTVDEDFLPGSDATTDRYGWPVEPKTVRSDADQNGNPETGRADTGRSDAGGAPSGERGRSRLDPDVFDGGS